jgi:uncharacterized membrane protein YeaQ/YmgE (transglycosylase-associated protein family)
MGIVSWILFGLIAGVVAKLLMPGRDPGGCIVTILLGVAGNAQYTQFDIGSLVTAVIGAMLLLFLYRLIAGRRA